MDYDGDGITDVISGSYDPGDIYLFKGEGKGRFAQVEVIKDEKGVPLAHHPVELARYTGVPKSERYDEKHIRDRVASFGSWPAMVDWDSDGDLDMVIGTFSGQLFLRTNTGTRKAPVWEHGATQVVAGGKGLKVDSHTAPVIADWDGDGLWDIVVGTSTGSVQFFKNTGSSKKPAFAAGQILVSPKSSMKFVTQYLAPGAMPTPGVRAQICVTDYDGDGRLDLILGDYVTVKRLRANLTEAEKEKVAGLIRDLAGVKDFKEASPINKQLDAFAEGKATTMSHVWLFRRKQEATDNQKD